MLVNHVVTAFAGLISLVDGVREVIGRKDWISREVAILAAAALYRVALFVGSSMAGGYASYRVIHFTAGLMNFGTAGVLAGLSLVSVQVLFLSIIGYSVNTLIKGGFKWVGIDTQPITG